jgi:exodeoxyribonuclease VII small subunit
MAAVGSTAPAPDERAPAADSYEAAVAELEHLVAEMEAGRLDLEASLAAYQRGSALLRFCQTQLAAAEQQVRVLEGESLVESPGDDHQN